ncbi:MAG TPA: hypothetical protein VNC50_02410, partial [Planctomycetia bacterium]|nr:hypothetical protein [Planctomycetia bacterium]
MANDAVARHFWGESMNAAASENLKPDPSSNRSALAKWWTWAKVASGLVAVLFVTLLLGESVRWIQTLWAVHPALGGLGAVALGAVVGYLVGVPVYRYWKTPKVAEPPDLPEGVKSLSDYRSVTRYLDRILATAEKNPVLASTRPQIAPARTELAALAAKSGDPAKLDAELAAWAEKTLAPIWRPVEKKVEETIYA